MTKHHYPRRKKTKYDADRDRASEARRQAAYPPLDDLGDYRCCHRCGGEISRLTACPRCGLYLLEGSPDAAQIAEAAARMREHSTAQMAAARSDARRATA